VLEVAGVLVAGLLVVVAGVPAAGVTAEVTVPAAEVTVPVVEVTAPAAEDAVPETAEVREPPRLEAAWVAAEAGAAIRRPMPNARHRPPTAVPKMYNSTFRTGTYQPFMPGTLIT
jgi:hypothetical protein